MDAEISGRRRLLQVGFMRRYDEGSRELKGVVDGGKIGAPLLVHCQHRNKQPGGAKHTTDTLVKRALVHEFDVTRWLLGEEYVLAQWVGGGPHGMPRRTSGIRKSSCSKPRAGCGSTARSL